MHFDIPVSTFNAHERAGTPGGRDFDEDTAAKYARWFRSNMLWLFHGRGSPDAHIDSSVVAEDEERPDRLVDEPMTVGSETGRRGLPGDASAQIDVTAGMGGGGLTIISDGVPGRKGMTFAAEHVRDFWRLPKEVTAALGLHAADIVVIPVQGDSMAETLSEGDYVFVDTRHRLPSPDGLYVLTDDFGGLVVKRLEVSSHPRDEEATVRIISDNPRHAPKERQLSDLQIIGRVVRRFGVVG
ncbi:S24 family peptidase [Xanthobacter sp. DSM 24535]|uniref:S24 family peptidase n=1 Tax=Roseixanthobacter psychrophilus TaxID=3119917 RepID=UPI003727DE0E